MNSRNLKILSALAIVVGLSVVGLVILIFHEEEPNPSSILTMPVEDVLTAAKAGRLDTFDQIMAAKAIIDQNKPPYPSLEGKGRAGEQTATLQYRTAVATYEAETVKQFMDAMEGKEVRNWQGWVSRVEWDSEHQAFTVGAFAIDPYAEVSIPRVRSSLEFLVEPSAHDINIIGVSEDQAQQLTLGDQIKFSGKVTQIGLYSVEVFIADGGISKQAAEEKTTTLDLQKAVITMERIGTTCWGDLPRL